MIVFLIKTISKLYQEDSHLNRFTIITIMNKIYQEMKSVDENSLDCLLTDVFRT